jgi:hypothetical protein
MTWICSKCGRSKSIASSALDVPCCAMLSACCAASVQLALEVPHVWGKELTRYVSFC